MSTFRIIGRELNTKISETACGVSVWNMHLWRTSHLILTQLSSSTCTDSTVGKKTHMLMYLTVFIVITDFLDKSALFYCQVETEDKFEWIGGSSIGGGTFWGLGALLTKTKVLKCLF